MTQKELITAGASGIGLSIAQAFVARGASVHAADRDPEAIERIRGLAPDIGASLADIGNRQDVQSLFDEMHQRFEGRAKLSGRSITDERALALRNQSIGRFTDPADIAKLVLFLSGPHARTITGQVFPIDGDSKAAQSRPATTRRRRG